MAAENVVSEAVKMREREISLVDMFVDFLLHWRMGLVAMLLGGILLGGFGYARSMERQQAADAQMRTLEEQQNMSPEERMKHWEAQGASLRSKLADEQLFKVHTAYAIRQSYAEQLDYQQNSLLMQLEPADIQQADLLFVIQAEDADCAYGARSAYERLLTSEAFFRYTEESCGLDNSVSELISLGQMNLSADQGAGRSAGQHADKINVFVQNVPQSSIFVLGVQLRHDDADTCSAMADAAEEFIRQQQKELEQTVGSHEIALLSRTQGAVADREVAEWQNIYTTVLFTLSSNYATLMKDFGTEEKAYLDYLAAGSPADNAGSGDPVNGGGAFHEAPAATAASGVSGKYVLFGAVLFACIYVFGLFIKYSMNNRLRSTDDICELYGIPQLGTVPAVSRKRFLGVVDQWILKLRYHNQRRFTPEESVGLAAVAVKMAARKKGARSVCLLGCELKGNTLEICGQIKKQLEEAGLQVNTLSNVLYDAEAMEQLGGAESVVLVETAGVTLYDEILKELDLLQRQEITVLGGLVAE
ncbi:MAG: hypothetical protein NC123_09975 [Butyrivibrio sp.]|nr:hypothetical protein [Acetatifactor muris]MCM1559861.1 hypothetical protein [Butyrivibrio sp.]